MKLVLSSIYPKNTALNLSTCAESSTDAKKSKTIKQPSSSYQILGKPEGPEVFSPLGNGVSRTGQTNRQTDRHPMDIVIYRLNRPRGQFSENKGDHGLWGVYQYRWWS